METKTRTETVRLDDNFIELKTIITQRLTNQELYDMYAKMSQNMTNNQQLIEQNKAQIVQAETQIAINEKQKEDLFKLAEDCRARLPSKASAKEVKGCESIPNMPKKPKG